MKRSFHIYCIFLITFFCFFLVSCDPISLKQTIDNLILGWTRAITLTSPTDEEFRAEKTPLLEWEAAGGATGYEVQISATEDFDGIESISVTEAQYEIPAPLTLSDERHWRVRAVKDSVSSDVWSETWSFIIAPSETPEIVATLPIGGSPYKMEYVDGYCYIPTGTAGIKIIDVTDPMNPVDVTVAGFAAYNNMHSSVIKKDQYLYFADDDPVLADQLYIYDVTNPASPVPVGTATTLEFDVGFGNGVEEFYSFFLAKWGPDLYALGHLQTTGNGVIRIDLDDPLNPYAENFTASSGEGFTLAVNGNYAFATINFVGVDVFKLSGAMSKISTFSIPSMEYGFIYFTENYASVTNQGVGAQYQLINIADPYNPVLTAAYDPGEANAGGIVIGIFAFVYGTTSKKAYVLDIRDISNPELLYVSDATFLNSISGNFAFGVDYYTGNFHVTDMIPGD